MPTALVAPRAITPGRSKGSTGVVACDDIGPTLALRAAQVPSPRWTEHWGVGPLAARLLQALASRLDQCLQHPLLVLASPEQRAVVLFGCHSFVVHGDARGLRRFGAVRFQRDFQLWPFLSRAEWRTILAAELQHVGAQDMACLFPALRRRTRRWVVATCLRLLDADPRFELLRNEKAIEAFAFDPDLVSIALRARIPSEAPALMWGHFQQVWRQERIYRRAAHDNPRLLPMVTAVLREGPVEPEADVIEVLATTLKAEASPRAWRYLARHGSRLLHLPWRLMLPFAAPMDVATRYLRLMADAGCPPPLPPRLTRAWLEGAPDDLSSHCPWWQRWLQPHVLACAARQARATQGQPHGRPSTHEFLRVAEWARTHLPVMDKHQRASGWRWLERQQQLHVPSMGDSTTPEADCWASTIGAFSFERWLVEPLLTLQDVLLARTALRNCLHNYVNEMRLNRVRLFGIRNIESSKLTGVIGLRSEPDEADEPGEWMLMDVRGVENRPAPQWGALAGWLAGCYNAAEQRGNACGQISLDLDMAPVPHVHCAAVPVPNQALRADVDADIPF